MHEHQLPLFDWASEMMGEGYRRLADFSFDEAEEQFNYVRETGQGEEGEIADALAACRYWRRCINQLEKNSEDYTIGSFYAAFLGFPFWDVTGFDRLRSRLLKFMADYLVKRSLFYVEGFEEVTAPDLFLDSGFYKKALSAAKKRVEDAPSDVYAGFVLAFVRWLSEMKGEAKLNYARCLLINPGVVPRKRILYEPLNTLIDEVGAEMAPAYGWVRDILPPVPLTADLKSFSESHKKALECYRLLKYAEKALKQKDVDACYHHRKSLKETAPELYKEYFDKLNGKNGN